jgi:hypothetical protein
VVTLYTTDEIASHSSREPGLSPMRSVVTVRIERAGYRRHRIEPGTAAYGNFLYVRPDPG